MPKLKLFKTVSGFHDSFVATTSRAAALNAWGARTDLFAMGAAEQVNDPAMLEAASLVPGEVLQRRRVGKDKTVKRRLVKPKATPDLKPLRATLRAVEKALRDAEGEAMQEQRALNKERAALDRREQAARRRHDARREKLAKAVEHARGRLAQAG